MQHWSYDRRPSVNKLKNSRCRARFLLYEKDVPTLAQVQVSGWKMFEYKVAQAGQMSGMSFIGVTVAQESPLDVHDMSA